MSSPGKAWSQQNLQEIFSISLDYPHASACHRDPSLLTVPTHVPVALNTRQITLQMLAVFRCFGFPEPEPWIIGTYVSTPPFHSHPWKVLRRDDGDCLSKKVILRVDGAPCWPPPPTEDLQDRHPAPLASLSSSSSVHLFFSPFLERRRLFLNLEKPLKYPAQSEAWGEGVAAPHGHTPASLSGRECYCFPHPYPSLTTCSGWGLARNGPFRFPESAWVCPPVVCPVIS